MAFHVIVYGTIGLVFVDLYHTRVTHTELQHEAPFTEVRDEIESRLSACESRITAIEGVLTP